MERCDEERRGTCACGVPGSLDEWEEGFGVWRTQTSQSTPRRPVQPLLIPSSPFPPFNAPYPAALHRRLFLVALLVNHIHPFACRVYQTVCDRPIVQCAQGVCEQ